MEEKLEEALKEIRIMKENEKDRQTNSDIGSNITNIGNIKSSRCSSYEESFYTDKSEDRLSIREVGKLKRLVVEKEKQERKNNIVFKGIKLEKEDKIKKGEGKEWVEDFLRKNLDIDCKIESCRISGKVIIVKLGSEEEKKEAMRRKNRLKDRKGEQIYIENDLIWEERKIQERINKWVKEKKSKGEEVKIGIGKVKIKGLWKFWSDIEKEEERREEREGE